jgi:AcrR family transcriptional regulator
MRPVSKEAKQADQPNSPTGCPLSVRDRVLKTACEMFAEAGFHGTHLREVCKRAATNVAGVCYHFQSKEGLYQAVLMEAGRRLSGQEGLVNSEELPLEVQLPERIESLIQRLSAGGAWIPKLLVRELVDVADGARNYAASGLERESILLQALLREITGAKANSLAIQLHALHLIADCVVYSLARENPHHPLTQLTVCLPGRAEFARSLTQRSLWALAREGAEPEVSRP